MLPNTILEVTEENTKHFKCVSIPMFMQIMQMSLRVSHSLHLPYKNFINFQFAHLVDKSKYPYNGLQSRYIMGYAQRSIDWLIIPPPTPLKITS